MYDSYIWNIENRQNHTNRKHIGDRQGEVENEDWLLKGQGVSFRGDELDRGGGWKTLLMYWIGLRWLILHYVNFVSMKINK